ncbi:MAG: HD domain-containing protein [Bacilli bacterium]
MNKELYFKKEISYILNDRLKENLIKMINLLPDYFFIVPASSTGKYHPSFTLGENGLVKHTKVAVRIAKELLDNETFGEFYTHDEKDLLLMSLLVHDGLKSGLEKSEYTLVNHPILIGEYLLSNKELFTLSNDEIKFIVDATKTHMGPWVNDYKGNKVLDKPITKYQRFVHMCDYLASRKFLNVDFDGIDIKE